LSIDDTIKSVEDALERAEDIGDILNEAVIEFGKSLSDCIDMVSTDFKDMFSDVFRDAASTFAYEFNLVTDDISKAMKDAFNTDDLKKQIDDLRKEIDRINRSGAGGRRGGSDEGQDNDSGSLRQRLAARARRGAGGFLSGIKDDIVNLLGVDAQQDALANRIASEFRQIQRDRGGQATIMAINKQLNDLRMDMGASQQDLEATYGSAIQAGFTEKELMQKEDGMTPIAEMLRTDKLLRIGPGGTAEAAKQMNEFSDSITASNAADKLLEMKVAAEKSGVSFNKFSSAAMEIGASLRPLGLDISHTTSLLSDLTESYKDMGMGEERAFALARQNLGAIGQSFGNLDIALLGTLATQLGSDKLKETFKGQDALEAGINLKLLAQGGGEFADDPEKRAELMTETFTSLVKVASDATGGNRAQMIRFLTQNANLTEMQSDSLIRMTNKLGDDASPEAIKELQEEAKAIFATDRDNVSSIDRAVNKIEGILGAILKASLGGILSIVAGLDAIGSALGVGIMEESDRISIANISTILLSNIGEQFKGVSEVFKALKESQKRVAAAGVGGELSANYDAPVRKLSDSASNLTDAIRANTAALTGDSPPPPKRYVPPSSAIGTEAP